MSRTFRHRPFTKTGSIGAFVLLIIVFAWTAPAWASTTDAGSSCATPITTAPNGAATVSASSTSYHRVLAVGSGPNAGCSLYLLTSDQPSATPPSYACTLVCATTIWPALLTNGAPMAGPGINPQLLGTVTRTDILANTSVEQVTYSGAPVYQFFMDRAPGQIHGANLFDPFAIPPGIWYLLSPGRGLPDPGVATLSHETVVVSSTGKSVVVLAALLDQGLGGQLFPVYSFSADSDHQSACLGKCAVFWPPVLTTERAQASDGVSSTLIGIIVRPDGSHQVTYAGHPLYLFVKDAALPGTPGVAYGSGISAFGGTFNLIPPQ